MHQLENKTIFYLDRNTELGLEPGRNYYYQHSFETVNGGQILKIILISKPTQEDMERAISLAEFQKSRRGLAIITTTEQIEKEEAEEEEREV